jgi:hypothetical protein
LYTLSDEEEAQGAQDADPAFAAVEPTGSPAFEAVEPTGGAAAAKVILNEWKCANELKPINETIAFPNTCLTESNGIICAPFASTDHIAATDVSTSAWSTFICESIPSTDHKGGKNTTDVQTGVWSTGAGSTGTDSDEHFMTRFLCAPARAAEKLGCPGVVATSDSTGKCLTRSLSHPSTLSWTSMFTQSLAVAEGGGDGTEILINETNATNS